MDVINYSDARKGLMDVMDRVVETLRPVLIVRPMAEAVVVVSLADWNALEATTHLLSTLTTPGGWARRWLNWTLAAMIAAVRDARSPSPSRCFATGPSLSLWERCSECGLRRRG